MLGGQMAIPLERVFNRFRKCSDTNLQERKEAGFRMSSSNRCRHDSSLALAAPVELEKDVF